ncbi:PepSY domain-containing protein [Streptococcus entericus]|uniref:PepSY domain-containing protein n=1 Tax=Streptococcus entericus TaxID=155680 RepID=UPI00035D1B57|nr:PepSY domain-containing protein [Streptococcus entericus]
MRKIQTLVVLGTSFLTLAACTNNQPSTTNTMSSSSASSSSQVSSTAQISQDQAKLIAFDAAMVKEGDVSNLTIREDLELGQKVYEIAFVSGNRDYSYTVKASDGSILERENEPADATVATELTPEQAKETALQDAGLTEQEVTNLTVTQDTEGMAVVFDVDFDYNGMEYSYTIDATTGQVISQETELTAS